jgi:hypothetical protein
MTTEAPAGKWLFVLLASVAVLAAWFIRAQTTNPYAYDVSHFAKVDPQSIRFDEVAQLSAIAEQPHGLAVDAQDRILVCGAKSVAILDGSGKTAGGFALPEAAHCLAARDGEILVGFRDRVAVFDHAGSNLLTWVSLGENAVITSLAVGQSDVFVADAGARVVWRFDRSGRLLGKIGDKEQGGERIRFIVPSPYFDVAFGPRESLWIVNPGERRVEHFSFDGKRLGFWGRTGMTPEGFAGCCNPIHIALRADGAFVTSEKGLPRVKIYDASGAFVGFVAGPQSFSSDAPGLDLAIDSVGRVLVLDTAKGLVRIFVEKPKP